MSQPIKINSNHLDTHLKTKDQVLKIIKKNQDEDLILHQKKIIKKENIAEVLVNPSVMTAIFNNVKGSFIYTNQVKKEKALTIFNELNQAQTIGRDKPIIIIQPPQENQKNVYSKIKRGKTIIKHVKLNCFLFYDIY